MLPNLARATLIVGDPPRSGQLAFWADDFESAPGRPTTLELVLPSGTSVRRRQVPAVAAPIGDLIDELVGVDPSTVGPELRVWAAATRAALDMISRGRLTLAETDDGWDSWRIGPFDAIHRAQLTRLSDALPPFAHATPVPGARPLQISTAGDAIRSFYDTVADTFVRTASAARIGGQRPFAAEEPTMVAAASPWLASMGSGGREEPSVALRLEPPIGPDDAFSAVLQVHSSSDPGLILDADDLWNASEIVLSRFGDRAEEAVLLALRRGSRVFPPLERLLAEARPARLILDDEEAEALLGDVAMELGAAGLELLWPVELTRALAVRTVVGTEQPEILTGGAFALDQLLSVRYEALLDGETLTAEELDQLTEAKRPMIRLRGRFVAVNPALVARLRERQTLPATSALSLALVGQSEDTAAFGTDEVKVVGSMAELARRLREVTGERERAEPAGLVAELRHYQRRGLAWLVEMASLGLGGCLADDMGLGKTIQLIAAHLGLAEVRGAQPTLVVCPASLLGNWRREIRRFAPDTPERRFHGSGRSLDDLADDEIVVTTYGILRRDHEALADVSWGLVVADEAQHVKNPFTRSARALRSVPAAARFAMTGTPVENRLSELWSLLDWTTPGLLPPLDAFQREVAVPIERDRDSTVTDRFGRLVQPFLLRRRKIDPGIAPELPPKTETDVPVLLSTEQATLYRAVVEEALERIERTEGINRQGLVFKLLTGLKQICNHPAHYLAQRGPIVGRSGKLAAAEEILNAAVEGGESVLVFTQYVAMGHLLAQRISDLGLGCQFLHGSLPISQRDEMVDAFQRGESPIFVLSLKAAGTGLNLTKASQVIHYDRWWNPAVEDQASDRAWRIGQDRPVQVHRLITEGTLEERIAATLVDKRRLAEAVVGAGESWIADLDDHELRDLLTLSDGSSTGRNGRRPAGDEHAGARRRPGGPGDE